MFQLRLSALSSSIVLPRLLDFATACLLATSPHVPRGVRVCVVDSAGRVVL